MSFTLFADKNQLSVCEREPVTSGSQNVYTVRFSFSPDWDGMAKFACFKSGTQAVTVALDENGECLLPWEVMDPDDVGKKLFAGVCGSRDDGVVLPTIWADLGVILEGTSCGQNSRPPTPGLLTQLLSLIPQPMTADQLQNILKNGGTTDDENN